MKYDNQSTKFWDDLTKKSAQLIPSVTPEHMERIAKPMGTARRATIGAPPAMSIHIRANQIGYSRKIKGDALTKKILLTLLAAIAFTPAVIVDGLLGTWCQPVLAAGEAKWEGYIKAAQQSAEQNNFALRDRYLFGAVVELEQFVKSKPTLDARTKNLLRQVYVQSMSYQLQEEVRRANSSLTDVRTLTSKTNSVPKSVPEAFTELYDLHVKEIAIAEKNQPSLKAMANLWLRISSIFSVLSPNSEDLKGINQELKQAEKRLLLNQNQIKDCQRANYEIQHR
ncbi:hypothetical protein BH10CYA1_BH10CYA1_03200 [soil metagenome]